MNSLSRLDTNVGSLIGRNLRATGRNEYI
jgi:hypothetical protein